MGGFEPIDASALRTAAGAGIRSDSPSAEVICEELQRLLNSVTFATARAQKKFLQYTVTEALEGRGHLLKEFTLGVEVFGRGQSFDPRTHNIVRVEASKLRAKLTRYYATEGRDNPVRVALPKGSYAPLFHWNRTLDSPKERAPEPAQAHSVNSAPTRSLSWHHAVGLASAAVALVLLGAVIAFKVRGPTAADRVPSVAVLPFVNLNNDGNDLLSDGITE